MESNQNRRKLHHRNSIIVLWYRLMICPNYLLALIVSYCLLHIPQIQQILNFCFVFAFTELIPRPARACQDPPLYLRLRMGKPIGKSMSLPSYVMSYGKNKLRPEFWFSIPKNRTDELYRFLNTWVPHLYGELDEEKITERGFELIQNDTDWMKSGQNKVCKKKNNIHPKRIRTMK